MRFTNNLDLGGHKLINQAVGTNAGDAVNKSQLDSVAYNNLAKPAVRLATVANITMSGVQAIDGEFVSNGDRVLVKNQTDAVQNGIYVVNTSGAWVRSTDFSPTSNVVGASVFVLGGILNAGKVFFMSTPSAVVNTTALSFIKFSDGVTYTSGYGISISNGAIAVNRTLIPSKYSALVGDNVNTVYSVTHGLNTQDIVISVRKVLNNEAVNVDWVANGANTVQLTFTTQPSIGEYRITVIG